MSLLCLVWANWSKLCETSHEEKICFICTKLGHFAKNCIKTRRIEDEKKAKADNIKKQMRQKWVPKSLENANQDHEVNDSQVNELGD